ncbi:hypothetical protein [Humibacter sp.]|uniref:hypothetical protein n=1 Tax=Humibacter sp. TaxID=1940291 RepID=UPI002BB3C827|nr:hypothetical protein [Humibacter sp.]HVX07176.1 hypothetical protein [Humibacter sp.]
MLAVPVVAWATVAGLVAAVTALWCLPLAHGAAWLAEPACWWMVRVAHLGARVPGVTLGWPSGAPGVLLLATVTGAAIAAVTVAVVVARRRRRA